MGIGGAIIGSAVIGGASSILGGKSQEKAAKAGADAQTQLGYANIDLQKELAEQQREDFAPWRDIGEDALNKLWSNYRSGKFDAGSFDGSKVNVTQDPGYQFRMNQGVEALDKSAAARGRLLSGSQQKALTEYGQGVGSQEYANAYSRALTEHGLEQDRLSRNYNILSGLSGMGQASAARQAGATSQQATQSANILSGIGQAQANAAYQQAQARAGAYQGLAQTGNQAMQNWMLYKMMG